MVWSNYMRMYFNSNKAWNQLTSFGKVTTLRKAKAGKRRMPSCANTTEIFRHGKDTGLQANRLFIRYIEFGRDDDALKKHLSLSGFSTVKEWKDEAIRLSGRPKIWRLYIVTL